MNRWIVEHSGHRSDWRMDPSALIAVDGETREIEAVCAHPGCHMRATVRTLRRPTVDRNDPLTWRHIVWMPGDVFRTPPPEI